MAALSSFRGLPQITLGEPIPAYIDQDEYNLYNTFVEECITLGNQEYISQILAYTPPDTSDSDVEMVDSDLSDEIPEVSDIPSDEAEFETDDRDVLLIEEILAYFPPANLDVPMEDAPEASDVASDDEDIEMSDSNDSLMEYLLASILSDHMDVETNDSDASFSEDIPEVSESESDDGADEDGYLADSESSDDDEEE